MFVLCGHSDIMMIYNDPPPGMFIVPDKEDMTIVCILLNSLFFWFWVELILVKGVGFKLNMNHIRWILLVVSAC